MFKAEFFNMFYSDDEAKEYTTIMVDFYNNGLRELQRYKINDI